MNNIQNYGSVNVNYNYGKVNKSPNFKAFVISEAGAKTLKCAQEILEKEPTDLGNKFLFNRAVELLNKIKVIKPLADATKFYDVVLDECSFGLKKTFYKEPLVNDYDALHSEGNKIFTKYFGKKQFVAELKDEATAKKFEGKMDFAKFCDLLKELEENAHTKVNDAMETLNELLGNNIKIVQ